MKRPSWMRKSRCKRNREPEDPHETAGSDPGSDPGGPAVP